MKRTLTYLVLALLAAFSISLAQTEKQLSENAIENLVSGINSENNGLKRSSIYFAGYYKVESVVDELREVMFSDDDPSTQILAALALYEIGDEDVLDDLAVLSQKLDENAKVRKMAGAIHEYWTTRGVDFASVAK